jgi:threonine synthase
MLCAPSVQGRTGVRPALPDHLSDLLARRERTTIIAKDQPAIEAFVRSRARATRGAAA